MGPTIHPGETATIKAFDTNKGKEAFKTYPFLTIYERTLDGKKVYNNTSDGVLLQPDKQTAVSINIPDIGLKSGVYMFTLEQFDSAGNQVGRTIEGTGRRASHRNRESRLSVPHHPA